MNRARATSPPNIGIGSCSVDATTSVCSGSQYSTSARLTRARPGARCRTPTPTGAGHVASLVNAVVVDTSVDIIKVDQASAFAVGPTRTRSRSSRARPRVGRLGAAVALRGFESDERPQQGWRTHVALRRRAAGAGAGKGGRTACATRSSSPTQGAAAAGVRRATVGRLLFEPRLRPRLLLCARPISSTTASRARRVRSRLAPGQGRALRRPGHGDQPLPLLAQGGARPTCLRRRRRVRGRDARGARPRSGVALAASGAGGAGASLRPASTA